MENDLGMTNFMEELVKIKMPDVLKGMPDICRCSRCDMDRMAFALNSLPTKYVVTRKGKLYAKLDVLEGQFDVDVIRAITGAAVRVDMNPRCQQEEEF